MHSSNFILQLYSVQELCLGDYVGCFSLLEKCVVTTLFIERLWMLSARATNEQASRCISPASGQSTLEISSSELRIYVGGDKAMPLQEVRLSSIGQVWIGLGPAPTLC